jgi:hypothetical protein
MEVHAPNRLATPVAFVEEDDPAPIRRERWVAVATSPRPGEVHDPAPVGVTRKVSTPVVVHVIEHDDNLTTTDLGPTGDSEGDLLSWANQVYDASNAKVVGRDQGSCIRTSVTGGSWQCSWTTWINGEGSLTVEGPFYDTKDSTMAITGGTGSFNNARGVMQLSAHNDAGTEYDYIFHVIP